LLRDQNFCQKFLRKQNKPKHAKKIFRKDQKEGKAVQNYPFSRSKIQILIDLWKNMRDRTVAPF
jgi:hypothetical protein